MRSQSPPLIKGPGPGPETPGPRPRPEAQSLWPGDPGTGLRDSGPGPRPRPGAQGPGSQSNFPQELRDVVVAQARAEVLQPAIPMHPSPRVDLQKLFVVLEVDDIAQIFGRALPLPLLQEHHTLVLKIIIKKVRYFQFFAFPGSI